MQKIFNALKIAAAFAAAQFALAAAAPAQTAEEYFMLGNNAYKAGDFAKAERNYSDAEKLGLKSAELYFNRANANVKNNAPAKALADYLKTLAIAPRMREASANLSALSRKFSVAAPDTDSPFFELSKSEWIAATIACFWIFMLLAIVPPLYGKGGKAVFFLALTAAAATVVGGFGIKKWSDFGAIAVVVKQDAPVKLSPAPNAPIETRLSEGKTVAVKKRLGGYVFAEIGGSRAGWIDAADVSQIGE